MIKYSKGNILLSSDDAIINTVNIIGVAGKGLALQFKNFFPECYEQYKIASQEGKVKIGLMHIAKPKNNPPHYVINFPTKEVWWNPSQIEYIETGLVDLVNKVKELNIKYISIPPLGCGLGGLDWKVVKPMVINAFSSLENITITLYEPRI